MLKRQYLGYVILGLGLILLIVVFFSEPESVNSQRSAHSEEWVKPFALSVLCDKDCPPNFRTKISPATNFDTQVSLAGELENESCVECHGDGIATDIDFLVSPQEMTHQLQVRFLAISKRVFALQPSQDNSQYQALMDNYMQVHQRQVLGNPVSNPTEVGSALQLLTTVEHLVDQIENQNHWAEIHPLLFNGVHDAVSPLKVDQKCGVGGTHFIHSIKPPASSPEKHVSDTPITSIEIKWSISRRGPPAFSTLISHNTRRLQPFIYGRSSFILKLSAIIPLHCLSQRLNLAKEPPIEQIVVNRIKEVGHFRLHVTASKHLEKSLR